MLKKIFLFLVFQGLYGKIFLNVIKCIFNANECLNLQLFSYEIFYYFVSYLKLHHLFYYCNELYSFMLTLNTVEYFNLYSKLVEV